MKNQVTYPFEAVKFDEYPKIGSTFRTQSAVSLPMQFQVARIDGSIKEIPGGGWIASGRCIVITAVRPPAASPRERLEAVAEVTGDSMLAGVYFWDLFDLLPRAKQERIVKDAEAKLAAWKETGYRDGHFT